MARAVHWLPRPHGRRSCRPVSSVSPSRGCKNVALDQMPGQSPWKLAALRWRSTHGGGRRPRRAQVPRERPRRARVGGEALGRRKPPRRPLATSGAPQNLCRRRTFGTDVRSTYSCWRAPRMEHGSSPTAFARIRGGAVVYRQAAAPARSLLGTTDAQEERRAVPPGPNIGMQLDKHPGSRRAPSAPPRRGRRRAATILPRSRGERAKSGPERTGGGSTPSAVNCGLQLSRPSRDAKPPGTRGADHLDPRSRPVAGRRNLCHRRTFGDRRAF